MVLTAQQLTTLRQRVALLNQMSQAIDSRHTAKVRYKLRDKSLFYPGLFQTKSTQLNDFVSELGQSMSKLESRINCDNNSTINSDIRSESQSKNDSIDSANNATTKDLILATLVERIAHQHRALHAVLTTCHISQAAMNKQASNQIAESSANYQAEQINNLDVSPALNIQGKLQKVLNKSHFLYTKLAQQQEFERRLEVMITEQQDPTLIATTKQRLVRCQAATKKIRLQLQRYEQKQDH